MTTDPSRILGLLAAAAVTSVLSWPARAQEPSEPAGGELSPALVQQIEALMAEKAQRTPAQRKVSSHLLHAQQIQRGEPIAAGVVLRQSLVEPGGMVTVDIRADVTPEVLARIEALGGSLIGSVPQYRAIRARLPLAAVETLAELDAVQSIRPADQAVTRGQTRAIREAAGAAALDPAVTRKINTSEGDVAHQADRARRQYGVDGTGIGIGVLSDGVDSLADLQASGDLPATVTVLPGQARPAEADATDTFDEGTAMLEIVHDLAPGAELYFATAFNGQAQFAANIEALCAAGAEVIVDDIGYFREAAFQDDVVAQGINAAVAAGCVYFSAGGNNGNLNDGTSGVWEGDFNDGGTFTISGERVGASHVFRGSANVNRITDYAFNPMCLKWADPLGASTNDYDLYLVDPDDAIIYTGDSSTDTQNGTQDPVECIYSIPNPTMGNRVDLTRFRLLVIKTGGGANRYLHLNTHSGTLAIATDGQMYDHAAAANAIGVAATEATEARGAGGVFDGTESVRRFSSDGPRRIFFHPDGRAITPGNFSSTGGLLLQKPDVTAADGVSTATPEFETFPGTSAAAPHAAAIAALMLQAAGGPRSLTRAQLLQAMQDTALDIEAPGDWDRDSGAGIVDALAAVGAAAGDLFTDPVLTAGSTGVKAVHLTELRRRIDAARSQCGLTNVPWTDPNIVPGVTPIKAAHVTQPRNALVAAYRNCGRTPPSWTAPQIISGVTSIEAVHFTELRNAVLALGMSGPPPPPPPPPGSTFGAGTWHVGTDINPGRYFTNPIRACYWERLSGLSGQLVDVIANGFIPFDSGQEIVDVGGSDLAFKPDAECGTWGTSPAGSVPAGQITPGRWLIGSQVPAGTYRATVPRGCYYEGVRSFGGTLDEIIANNFLDAPTRLTLTIDSSVTGFYTDDDCGTWNLISSTATTGTRTPWAADGWDTDAASIGENLRRYEATQTPK